LISGAPGRAKKSSPVKRALEKKKRGWEGRIRSASGQFAPQLQIARGSTDALYCRRGGALRP